MRDLNKSLYFFNFFIFVVCILSGSAFSQPITLIENGISKTTIFVKQEVITATPGETAAHKKLRESVKDLVYYLEKITGTKVGLITKSPEDHDDYIPILIGDYAIDRFGPTKKTDPYKQSWRLVISEKGIGMIGQSEESTTHAIYEFLERIGCRWYMPGEIGQVIPQTRTISLEPLDISETPQILYRNILNGDDDFKRRNRLGGIELESGQVLEAYIDEEILDMNLDWRAMIRGKRNTKTRRLCWSNSEVSRAIADAIIEKLKKCRSYSVSLSPGDGIEFCQCPGCKALDAGDFDPTLNCISVTDRYIHFLNQIVQKVTEKFPEVKFGFLVYVQYSRPPLRERLHSNLIPVITPITFCRAHSVENESCESRKKLREIVEKWSKISGSGLGLYEYGFNLAEVSVPFPMITKWSQDLKFFFSHNVRYWIPETMANFDTALPGLYLGIKLAWNPEENPEKILEELYDKFYGPAAEYMKGYWQTMDDAWTKTTSHTGCVFGYQQRFTQETMKKARDAINEALRNCPENTLYYQRVKMVDESFNQFELFMKMLRNFHSCNFSNIESDAETWVRKQTELGNKYEKNYAFCKSDRNWAVRYFTIFLYPAYKDAARIHQNYDILTAITEWKYRVDKENSGEKQGWFKRNFDDASWEIINPSEKTWADIGLWDYYGAVWYRKIVKIPNIPEGKKIYLWIGLGDDTFKVYVNGQHISYRTHDGKQLENFSGYCKPVSFDITEAVEKGKENQITIIGIRSTINELGTGGIMSPVLIYRDK